MKALRLLALAALLPHFAPSAGAAENKYDVLARVLMPFANLLAERAASPNRAVQLTLRLEAMTNATPALAGARAEIALQHPDKLRMRGPVLGEMLTIARDGQRLWVAPGSRAEALLAAAARDRRLPPLDPKARLEPFRLPVPEKQLVFLPALFQVQDGGFEKIADRECRVLGLRLAPELERSLEVPDWSGWLWVAEKGVPARLVLQRPQWEIAVRFERVEFSKSLPATTWQPDSAESADVLKLTPAQYQQLLSTLLP